MLKMRMRVNAEKSAIIHFQEEIMSAMGPRVSMGEK